MTDPIWWAIARSEEVSKTKTLAVDLAAQPIVLWRDASGAARALEDRCPHRRAPLSLGCVLGNGLIQCGYHGWTFDGADGRLKEIPNLKSTQKFPPLYSARSFATAEAGGFIWLCADRSAAPPSMDFEAPFSGSVDVAIDHAHFVDALFDDPSLLIAIKGVKFTTYLSTELKAVDGRLIMERYCQWSGPQWPAPFSSEFPLSLLIVTHPVTGQSRLVLRDDKSETLLDVHLSPVPGARGVTQIRWRAKQGKKSPGLLGRMLGAGAPFSVHPHIDAAALRALKPSVSLHAQDLRDAILTNPVKAAG